MGTYKPGDAGYDIYPPGTELHPKSATSTAALSVSAVATDFSGWSTSLANRWRGRRLARALDEAAEGQRVATEVVVTATIYERAKQDLELARQQAALVPLKIEHERQQLQAQLLEGQALLSAVLQRHQHATELAAAEHEIALLDRKTAKVKAKLRIKEAKRALEALKEPLRGDTTEDFRRHYRTAERVRANRSEADTLIDAIYARARAERRNLSADEIEEVDALADAAEAAEADVRRRAASGI